MRIAVLVKQVPATEDVKIDNKKGTLIREKSEVETNPTDLTAISQAVRIKKTIGKGEVVAISMGPSSAIKTLREALSLGCDKAFLISDKICNRKSTKSCTTTVRSFQNHSCWKQVFRWRNRTSWTIGSYATWSMFHYLCDQYRKGDR